MSCETCGKEIGEEETPITNLNMVGEYCSKRCFDMAKRTKKKRSSSK